MAEVQRLDSRYITNFQVFFLKLFYVLESNCEDASFDGLMNWTTRTNKRLVQLTKSMPH